MFICGHVLGKMLRTCCEYYEGVVLGRTPVEVSTEIKISGQEVHLRKDSGKHSNDVRKRQRR